MIVARNVDKLESALQEIKVVNHSLDNAGPVLTYLQGRSFKPLTTLPLPQRRRHQTKRSRPHRQRSNSLEQRCSSRHRLVHRRRLLPHPLPRRHDHPTPATNGPKLLVPSRHGPRDPRRLVDSRLHRLRHSTRRSATPNLHIHLPSLLLHRRLRPILPTQNSPALPLRHAYARGPPVHALDGENPHRLPWRHPNPRLRSRVFNKARYYSNLRSRRPDPVPRACSAKEY